MKVCVCHIGGGGGACTYKLARRWLTMVGRRGVSVGLHDETAVSRQASLGGDTIHMGLEYTQFVVNI